MRLVTWPGPVIDASSADKTQMGTVEFRQFRRKLFHVSLSLVLELLRAGETKPEIFWCPDGRYRRVIWGIGPRTLHCPTYSNSGLWQCDTGPNIQFPSWRSLQEPARVPGVCQDSVLQTPQTESAGVCRSLQESARLRQTLVGSKFILLIYKKKSITSILNTCYIRGSNSQPADFKI